MSWWLWPLCSQQTRRYVYIAFSCAVCQCRALVAGSGCIVRRGSKNICGLYEADNDVPTPLVATDTRGHIHTIYTATKVLGFQHLSSNGQWLIGMLAILPCVPTSSSRSGGGPSPNTVHWLCMEINIQFERILSQKIKTIASWEDKDLSNSSSIFYRPSWWHTDFFILLISNIYVQLTDSVQGFTALHSSVEYKIWDIMTPCLSPTLHILKYSWRQYELDSRFCQFLSPGCINFKNLSAHHQEEVLRIPKHPQLAKFGLFWAKLLQLKENWSFPKLVWLIDL